MVAFDVALDCDEFDFKVLAASCEDWDRGGDESGDDDDDKSKGNVEVFFVAGGIVASVVAAAGNITPAAIVVVVGVVDVGLMFVVTLAVAIVVLFLIVSGAVIGVGSKGNRSVDCGDVEVTRDTVLGDSDPFESGNDRHAEGN